MLPANPLLNATAPAGPHLPVALLRQYAAGILAPAAQHRVEAHTLACPRCADILAGLLQTPATTTDQALAQLQQRLRRRVQPQPAARPMLRQRRWLAPQLAAAAALLLGLVAGGWWAWQQRHTAAPAPLAVVRPTLAPPTAPAAPAAAVAPASVAKPLASVSSAELARARRLPRPAQPVAPQPNQQPTGQLAATPLPSAAPQLVAAAPRQAARPGADRTDDQPTFAQALADSARLPGRATKAEVAAPAAAAQKRKMPSAPPVAPAPTGGLAALREQLRQQAAGFVPASKPLLAGTVQLSFLVGADGKLEKITVLRGLRPDYDAEAQRLLREGPAWLPATQHGQPVAQQAIIAVPF